jgi:hypothetical protein
MAPRKSSNPGPSARYYAQNPKARKKKAATDKKVNARPSQRAKRAELAAWRRKNGLMGQGGPDGSHTRSGKIVRESPKTNRARKGKK